MPSSTCDFRPQPPVVTPLPCCAVISNAVQSYYNAIDDLLSGTRQCPGTTGTTVGCAGLIELLSGATDAAARVTLFQNYVNQLTQLFLAALKRFNCEKCEKRDIKDCCDAVVNALLNVATSTLNQFVALTVDLAYSSTDPIHRLAVL